MSAPTSGAPELARSWHDALPIIRHAAAIGWHALQTQPLVQLAVGSMVLIVLGGWIRRAAPPASALFRVVGNLGLIGALLLTVAQVMRLDTGLDLPRLGEEPESADVTVAGHETRVKMGPDGHFWVDGTVNGTPARFLVDTGATITTLAPSLAARAQLVPAQWGSEVILETANGRVSAERTTIATLRIGNVTARQLAAVVAPGMGRTSVLGMNFLSRLSSWRVEGRTLILVPHHPAANATA